jgi:hypothetical protein
MISREQKKIKAHFIELMRSPLHCFPLARGRLNASTKKGVYVISGPQSKVLHVGGTPRGRLGIYQRLTNHLHGQSSFTIKSKYLKRHGRTLRRRCAFLRKYCTYRYLVIPNNRLRALLETYAIGHLCPDHIGLHQLES